MQNVRFAEYIDLVEAFGFHLVHIRGSHYIYRHPEVDEPLNIQPFKGEAKAYQIRQFLELIELYDLNLDENN